MSTALEALQDIEAAVATVTGVRVFALGEIVDPPGVVVELPVLTPRTTCPTFTDATFTVYLVVALTDGRRVAESLLSLIDLVLAAIEEHTPAVVRSGSAGTYTVGGTELPAYSLDVEYPL